MADKPLKTEKKTETVVIPTAKRHKVLNDISTQLKGVELDDVFEIMDHKYQMTTLNADEEVWCDAYTNLTTNLSALSSVRIPRLAASIKSVDGVKVEEMFEFSSEADSADVEYHSQSQYRMRYWLMNQMLVWLGDRPRPFIDELWNHYTGLIDRRKLAMDELKNSSTRTLGGSSKASSSPVRESSSAIQTSQE